MSLNTRDYLAIRSMELAVWATLISAAWREVSDAIKTKSAREMLDYQTFYTLSRPF